MPQPSAALLKDLYEVTGGLCHHCGAATWLNTPPADDPDPGRRAAIEHTVPRGHGGNNDWNNLGLACQRCRDRRQQAARLPQSIPGWAEMVAEARAKAQRNPDAPAAGAHPGETYATLAFVEAATNGFADEWYGSADDMGYEVVIFRLTETDAQTLDYRNPEGAILSLFAVIRDEAGRAQTHACETETDLEAFISVIEDAIADHEAESEELAATRAQDPTPESGQQAQLL